MKAAATALIGALLCLAMANTNAAEARLYTEGPVTELSFVKIKPGQFDAYMKYLGTTYKAIMEAHKKAGLITGYAVNEKIVGNSRVQSQGVVDREAMREVLGSQLIRELVLKQATRSPEGPRRYVTVGDDAIIRFVAMDWSGDVRTGLRCRDRSVLVGPSRCGRASRGSVCGVVPTDGEFAVRSSRPGVVERRRNAANATLRHSW